MQIFPAIDLKDKQVVRLTQGDYGKVEVYGQDPAAAARGFAAQGAKYLHVVDLDGAKDGALSNFDAVSAIIAATGMFVEVGGGIRDEARVRAYLEQGAGRVIPVSYTHLLLLYDADQSPARVARAVQSILKSGRSVRAEQSAPEGLRVRQTLRLGPDGAVPVTGGGGIC